MAKRDPHVGFQQISNTEGADQVSVSGNQAQFGQGGSDNLTFSGTSPFSPGLALGGRGNDTYVVNAGENGGVFDGFGSSGDRLETPGLSFQNAFAAQIDGRHLWVGSSDGGTNVVILDWRDPDNRIESFTFGDGRSLSYAEATTAIDSGIAGYLGDFSLEQALSQAQVDIGIDPAAIRNAVSYYDNATPPDDADDEDAGETYQLVQGDQTITGTSATDVLVTLGPRDEYEVTETGTGLQLTGPQSSATMESIERIEFEDGTLAFDELAERAYRLYQAAFDRQPDTDGLGYWVEQIDQGTPFVQAAASFIGSDEFESLYGANPSQSQFVDLLYQNVLDREADADGQNYWLDQLDGSMSRPEVLARFSDSDENRQNVADQVDDGVWYT